MHLRQLGTAVAQCPQPGGKPRADDTAPEYPVFIHHIKGHEILHAARAFARDCAAGEQDADALTEEGFSRYLYSSGLPDPDLLIRPGGEKRISNYLLWQCAYSEFYFCDTLWPDFTEREFDKALVAYQQRERRFGGLKQEKQK